jgi:PKD repeat protein
MQMKKNFVPITFSIIILFLFSCAKKPVACFTFSTENVKVGDTITLLNCSTNFTDVLWNLPFGATATVVNPRVKMQNPGSYSATLTVGLENFEKQNTITQSITVLP